MTKVVNAASFTINTWTDGSRRSYPQPSGTWLASGHYVSDAGHISWRTN